jgi:hypothetical protein
LQGGTVPALDRALLGKRGSPDAESVQGFQAQGAAAAPDPLIARAGDTIGRDRGCKSWYTENLGIPR